MPPNKKSAEKFTATKLEVVFVPKPNLTRADKIKLNEMRNRKS